MTEVIGIILVLIGGIFSSVGSVFLKKTSATFGRSLVKTITEKNLIIGGLLYLSGTVFMITSLKFGDLSVIYSFASLSYIWIALLSIRYMNEKMTKFKLAGFAFIATGIILVLQ